MLPESRFASIGPQATIEETRRAQGAHGVVDLIVSAMTTGRLPGDADIDEHLAELKAACRQSRRYRDAVPVLHRIAALNPDRRHEMAAEIALVHWHLGEASVAVATLETAVAQQRNLPAWKRSLAFALVAEVAAAVIGRSALAAECVQLGRSSVTRAPRRARAATPAHTVEPAATTPARSNDLATAVAPQSVTVPVPPKSLPIASRPTAPPAVGRKRAKGPVRQLSVLGSAEQSNRTQIGTGAGIDERAGEPTRQRLTVIGGTAA